MTFSLVVLIEAYGLTSDKAKSGNVASPQDTQLSENPTSSRQLSAMFNRLRGQLSTLTNHSQSSSPANREPPTDLANVTRSGDPSQADKDDEAEDDDDDDDEEDDDDGDSNELDDDDVSVLDAKDPDAKIVTDLFGNKIKLQGNSTVLMSQNKGRDLGWLTIKALLLAPLIGLTLKSALIKGFLWSLLMYGLHLIVPGLLTTLGLGSGLVGFARQLRPDYAQLMLAHLSSLPDGIQQTLPPSIRRLTAQYGQIFQPVVGSIQSIPEGHCRFRAVCETASYLIRHTQFMSNSLQRLSATVYLNFGTEYSKAWLDGIVNSDCALKYSQCPESPVSMVASKLAEAVRPVTL